MCFKSLVGPKLRKKRVYNRICILKSDKRWGGYEGISYGFEEPSAVADIKGKSVTNKVRCICCVRTVVQ